MKFNKPALPLRNCFSIGAIWMVHWGARGRVIRRLFKRKDMLHVFLLHGDIILIIEYFYNDTCLGICYLKGFLGKETHLSWKCFYLMGFVPKVCVTYKNAPI